MTHDSIVYMKIVNRILGTLLLLTGIFPIYFIGYKYIITNPLYIAFLILLVFISTWAFIKANRISMIITIVLLFLVWILYVYIFGKFIVG